MKGSRPTIAKEEGSKTSVHTKLKKAYDFIMTVEPF